MPHLVLLFDGTWNDEKDPKQATNIHRLKDLVIEATTNAPAPAPRIFYDQGVGTGGWWDRILGGILGYGLNENVLQGYRFLSQFYKEAHVEDGQTHNASQILIFGFSRGAFTARSLAGFVAASGLLRKEHCTKKNQEFAWRYYRTPPKERMPADKAKLEALCHDGVEIKLLGVFDTVGSLGVPTGKAGNWAGKDDHFHDTKLGSAIRSAFHAVALDEHRNPFVPALFARPDNLEDRPVEQVWFPGVHSDIGGGYGPPEPGYASIADLSLQWMVSRIQAHGAGLPIGSPHLATTDPDDPHDSLGDFLISKLEPAYRLIDGRRMPEPPAFPHNPYSLSFPDVSWREKIHRSVFDLVIKTHLDTNRTVKYLPPQLLSIAGDLRQGRFAIVDHSGANMSFADVVQLLDAAEKAVGRPIFR